MTARGQRNNRLAPVRQSRPANKVHLPTHARVLPTADGVRAHLTGQVDLDGAVDGDNLGILPNHRRVVDVANVAHQHQRVLIDKVIQPPRAVDKACNDTPRVGHFLLAGHDAALDQFHHTIGKHLGVNAQAPVIKKRGQHRIRNRPNPHLQRRTVFDQGGAVFPDGQLDRTLRLDRALWNRRVAIDDGMKAADMNQPVSIRTRHVRVHLRHHQAGRLHRRQAHIHTDAQRAVAMPVRRRHLDQRDIDGQHTFAKQPRDLA